MPTFTPPTRLEGTSDPFWGRYKVPVGQSVVQRDGVFHLTPYPSLVEIADLTEGEEWFQGGRTYVVSPEIAAMLENDGFETGA